ncbi:MAG: TonB family protein [Moorea sp. SIO2I5]|nr:TonB family protein [Moorena sp. SIO2I5]
MSISSFCIKQREKEQKAIEKFLLYSLVGSTVFHVVVGFTIGSLWERQQVLAEEPIEFILVENPETPEKSPVEPPKPESKPVKTPPPPPPLGTSEALPSSSLNSPTLKQSLESDNSPNINQSDQTLANPSSPGTVALNPSTPPPPQPRATSQALPSSSLNSPTLRQSLESDNSPNINQSDQTLANPSSPGTVASNSSAPPQPRGTSEALPSSSLNSRTLRQSLESDNSPNINQSDQTLANPSSPGTVALNPSAPPRLGTSEALPSSSLNSRTLRQSLESDNSPNINESNQTLANPSSPGTVALNPSAPPRLGTSEALPSSSLNSRTLRQSLESDNSPNINQSDQTLANPSSPGTVASNFSAPPRLGTSEALDGSSPGSGKLRQSLAGQSRASTNDSDDTLGNPGSPGTVASNSSAPPRLGTSEALDGSSSGSGKLRQSLAGQSSASTNDSDDTLGNPGSPGTVASNSSAPPRLGTSQALDGSSPGSGKLRESLAGQSSASTNHSNDTLGNSGSPGTVASNFSAPPKPSNPESLPVSSAAAAGCEVIAKPKFPGSLEDQRIEARPVVELIIDGSGNVTDQKLVESSGYPAIDRAAMGAASSLSCPAPGSQRRVKLAISFVQEGSEREREALERQAQLEQERQERERQEQE